MGNNIPSTIWMYWENRKNCTKPAYLDLCLETIKKNIGNNKLIIISPDNLKEYLPEISPRVWRIKKIAHRVDYIRGHLLKKYGGFWLDSDVVLLRPLNMKELFAEHDFVGYGTDVGNPSINFFGAKKGCELITNWVAGMDKKLLGGIPKFRYKFKWTEIGYDILWKYSINYKYNHIKYKLVAPIHWNDWKIFFTNKHKVEELITDKTYCVMMFNKNMEDKLKNMSRDEVLNSNNLLSDIFKYALKLQ